MKVANQTPTEVHWNLAGSNPDGTVEQLAAFDLCSKRAGLLGLNAFIIGVRLSNPDMPRNVTTMRFNPPLKSSFTDEAGNQGSLSADIANTSVMVSVKTTTLKKQFRVYMSGCIDIAIVTDPRFPDQVDDNPNFTGPFSLWRDFLSSGAWGTRVKTNPQSAIVQHLVAGTLFPGLIGPQLLAPLAIGGTPLAVGSRIQLRGFRRTNPTGKDANGQWTIGEVVQGAGTITSYILRDSGGVDPLNFWELGLAQTIVPAVDAYFSLTIEGARTRKRGQSTEARRGRSRSRRSHG